VKGDITVCKAIDISDFLISLGNAETEDPMTNMRINKLMYFAQGWNLQRYGKPLFHADIKAWKYGPVVQSVYKRYQSFGRNIITECSPDFSMSNLSSNQIELLLDVYNLYRKFSTAKLVEMSHEENTPWFRTYKEGEDRTIPLEMIKEYFDNRPPLKKAFELPSDMEAVGRINPETGRTILPSDFDEGDDAYVDFA